MTYAYCNKRNSALLHSASSLLHGVLLGLHEEVLLVLEVLDVSSELLLLGGNESQPLGHSLLVEGESDGEDSLVLLVSSLLPGRVDSVESLLLHHVLVDGGLDGDSERVGGSLVNEHLGFEGLELQ